MIARFGAFTFDSGERRLTRSGADIHLTPKAFDLLLLLIEEAPRVVRKDALHERLWPGTFVSESSVLGLVKELRRSLDDRDPMAPIIRTAHRVGYAFCPSVEKASPRQGGFVAWVVIGAKRIMLQEGDNVIGRDPAALIQIDAPSVSRHHACIHVDEARAVLEDLASKNGTKIDGTAVTALVTLQDGSRIQVGSIVILFRASASGPSTETLMPD